jgi:uncharacterized repeat protein (TIGR01451 family)
MDILKFGSSLGRLFSLRGAVAVLTALLIGVGGVTRSAIAQSCPAGSFFELDTWYINSSTQTVGVLPENNGTTLRIDVGANGLITPADPSFPMPPELAPPFLASTTLRVSPTRRTLYAIGGQNASLCSDTTVRFYDIPAVAGQPLTLLHEVCLPNVQRSRIFYDGAIYQSGQFPQGSDARLAIILSEPFVGDSFLTVFNLEQAGPSGRVTVQGLHPGIGDIKIAQGSQALYVQHDLAVVSPPGADYMVVSLCPNSFGQIVNPGGGFLQQIEGGALDATIGAASGGVNIVSFTQNGAPVTSLPVPDCCASGVTPTAASLTLSVTASPLTLAPGQNITYTVRVANLGPAPATNVVVQAGVNFITTFQSASSGGTLIGSNVQWTIPSLPVGSNPTTFTYTVRAECAQTDYFARVNNVNAIAQNAPRVFAGLPQPGPLVVIPSDDPLVLAFSATPDVTPPLRAGDLITLSLTLTNPSTRDHVGVRFAPNLGAFGQNIELVSVQSVTRGVASLPTPTSVAWTGDIPAGQAMTMALRLRVASCLAPNVTSVGTFGTLSVQNACNVSVLNASFFSPAWEVVKDLNAELAIGPLQSGVIGPASGGHQAVRLGAALPLGLTLRNTSALAITDARMRLVVPTGLDIGTPAIIAPAPAGASYDAGTRTLTFVGTVPAQSEVVVRLNASITTPLPRVTTTLDGGVGTCVSTRSTLVICPVPAVPTGPTLFGLDRVNGVWVMSVGVDVSPRPFFGPVVDSMSGMDYLPGGAMWIAGAQCVRFNPETLDLLVFPRGAINAAQGLIPIDALIEPATGDVLISGTVRSGFHAALVRSNADATQTRQLITDSTTLAILGSMARTGSGLVGVSSLPSRVDNANSSRGVLTPDIASTTLLDYGLVPTIAVPAQTFTFTPPGTVRARYPVAIATRTGASSEVWAIIATQWVEGSIFNVTSATSVYSLARVDLVSGGVTQVIDVLAGDLRVGFGQPPATPSYPTPLTALNLTIVGGATGNVGAGLAAAPNEGVFVASRTELWRVDSVLGSPTATLVSTLTQSGAGGTVDLVSVNVGGAVSPRCSPADVAYDDSAPLPPAGAPGGVNNGVTEGDYNFFFANYFNADPRCDIADDAGQPLPPFGPGGIPPFVNNGVTEADYNVFFGTYFNGCAF